MRHGVAGDFVPARCGRLDRRPGPTGQPAGNGEERFFEALGIKHRDRHGILIGKSSLKV